MDDPVVESTWFEIGEMLVLEDGVTRGKMMSRPALCYDDKVFAFYTTKFSAEGGMGFKVGEAFDPSEFGIVDHAPLAPFKTKGPMRGWILLPASEVGAWHAVAKCALRHARA